MAIPRRNIIDPSRPTVCHCVSRCVRRCLLLEARDGDSDPDRWKRMLADRAVELVTLFAIDVVEWAILGNHFHLLLATHPDLVALWTDCEIAVRWRTLTPDYHWRRRKGIPYHAPAQAEEVAALLGDPDAIARARRALADVSAFHKFLKQRIAQLANAEDEVTGHFWEGRFKSIVAADAGAAIAHMVYIALNPVRAGIAASLEECKFSSIRDRIDEMKRRIDGGEFGEDVERAKRKLRALKLLPALSCDPGEAVRTMRTLPNGGPNPWKGGAVPAALDGLTVSAFLNEVDRVGRTERKGKRSLSIDRPPVLAWLETQLEVRLGPASERAAAVQAPVADATPTGSLAEAVSYAASVEEALSRGLANAIGNFSGGLRAVARRAAELGRRAVWAIFDPEGEAPRRRVDANADG